MPTKLRFTKRHGARGKPVWTQFDGCVPHPWRFFCCGGNAMNPYHFYEILKRFIRRISKDQADYDRRMKLILEALEL